jgi:hypothetical protein
MAYPHAFCQFLLTLSLLWALTTATANSVVDEDKDTELFYVKDVLGNVCLVMKVKASFTIPYSTTKNEKKTATVDLVKVAPENITGECVSLTLKPVETLELVWQPSTEATSVWKLWLAVYNGTNSHYFINHLQLTYTRDKEIFPSASDLGSRHTILAKGPEGGNLTLFETPVGQYYQCQSETKVPMEEDASMQVHSVMFHAFRGARNDTNFTGSRTQCSTDSFASNIVPIIVGSVLALLVLLILLTYLIGRRRSQAGYQNL